MLQHTSRSILSDLYIESDIYDSYSYASYADWEVEKTPESNLKKLEFNIDKLETDLKKIDFNININGDEIDYMNDKKVVHPNGDLTDDNDSNIEDHETQHKWINRNNSFMLLLKANYSRALSYKIRIELMIGKL